MIPVGISSKMDFPSPFFGRLHFQQRIQGAIMLARNLWLVVALSSVIKCDSSCSPRSSHELISADFRWIHFYLVDTTTNATMFRLRDGEQIENYFMKGQPVAIRVDPVCNSVAAMRLILNDGALVKHSAVQPFSFGEVTEDFLFSPLRHLRAYGTHSLIAIPFDENGNEGDRHTISISVVRESTQRRLFMDSPERKSFNDHVFRGGVLLKTGSTYTTRSRLRPWQRRVRLHSLQLKHLRPRRQLWQRLME